jgi:hypothetical protein
MHHRAAGLVAGQSLLDQHLCDLTDGWLVLAVMTEKNIKDFRFGILSVHTEAFYRGNRPSRKINFAAPV